MFYGVLKGENKKPSNSKDLKRITVAKLVTIFNPELIILGGRIVQSRARVYRRRQSSQIKDERGPATNRCLCLGFGNALFDRKMEFVALDQLAYYFCPMDFFYSSVFHQLPIVILGYSPTC